MDKFKYKIMKDLIMSKTKLTYEQLETFSNELLIVNDTVSLLQKKLYFKIVSSMIDRGPLANIFLQNMRYKIW